MKKETVKKFYYVYLLVTYEEMKEAYKEEIRINEKEGYKYRGAFPGWEKRYSVYECSEGENPAGLFRQCEQVWPVSTKKAAYALANKRNKRAEEQAREEYEKEKTE